MAKKRTKDPTGRIWPAEAIPLKIELTGQATEPVEDKITMLVEVMRTIGKDFGITIDYPAMIYLDDLEQDSYDNHPIPNP